MERLQRTRVVPVVEMTAVAFQLVHRRESIGGAPQEFSGRDIAKIVRGKVCQQRHAHIGRRSARRDGGCGILLIVVGWKPVIRRTDEVREVAPGPPGRRTQKRLLFHAQLGIGRHKRPADPPARNRRCQPEEQQRRTEDERLRRAGGIRSPYQCQPQRGSYSGPGPHLGKESGQGATLVAARIGRQLPEQQSALREQHTHTRAQDCIRTNQRVIRQQDQAQHCKHYRPEHGPSCQARVHQPVALRGLAEEFDHGRQQRRHAHHRGDHEKPEPRRPRTEQPSACQHGEQR